MFLTRHLSADRSGQLTIIQDPVFAKMHTDQHFCGAKHSFPQSLRPDLGWLWEPEPERGPESGGGEDLCGGRGPGRGGEGAAGSHRQRPGSLLRRGPIRAERLGLSGRQDRHLESRVDDLLDSAGALTLSNLVLNVAEDKSGRNWTCFLDKNV